MSAETPPDAEVRFRFGDNWAILLRLLDDRRIRSAEDSNWHDLVDWVGGYPFEVARPEQVFEFCRDRGFRLERLRTAGGGHGTDEFVFRRETTTIADGAPAAA